MGKRIQKLKAKQPRAKRLNAKEQQKTTYRLLEAGRKCDNFLKCYSEVPINDKYISSGFIIGFGGTRIQQMVHALNNFNISLKVNPISISPIIDKIAEDIIKGLDSIK